MTSWFAFIWVADEWLIAYSLPVHLYHVNLFQIGHAVELYLKASYTKITGDSDKAIKFGHNIKALWDACKAVDAGFMPGYEIRDNVLQQVLEAPNMSAALSPDDYKHFERHQELYLIAKSLPDFKYGSLPWKSVKGRRAPYAIMHPNTYWILFFKELRSYLGYPFKGVEDTIRRFIEEGDLPSNGVSFLNGLYK